MVDRQQHAHIRHSAMGRWLPHAHRPPAPDQAHAHQHRRRALPIVLLTSPIWVHVAIVVADEAATTFHSFMVKKEALKTSLPRPIICFSDRCAAAVEAFCGGPCLVLGCVDAIMDSFRLTLDLGCGDTELTMTEVSPHKSFLIRWSIPTEEMRSYSVRFSYSFLTRSITD
uniref:Uncharacterized protein n=1 Tax=Oryza sativa subsp. japonica TaxID=39947 RepID=Q5YLZ4_ORYSJ|nr:hypothetical protein [Oryza sativa Japonica Group]